MSEAQPAGSLSDAEFTTFVNLLQRFSEHELDQFQLWRLNTTYDPVYINIGRYPVGASPQNYDDLDAWRAAQPD
ncbi:hypothetical protein E1200_31540 [Actinomadura sp. GC306]|uniref:hypothetical protein n=1 Tax=Actinomadura sp. GC306 TaxID=2530367 RepID=UPI001045A958|nr:hypothetical protein [Actinomadura sp. GC306]TDC59810.1 hypothetical protein E1200_31540 [Actinomadura sp. GC306]